MKNSIRCCISCILPCGALDVIRIVHSNGRVEEISGTIRAADIMKAYPKHVLKKPSTSASDDGIVPKIVVVPPDAELRRGKIYFLMPLPPNSSSSSSTPQKKKKNKNINVSTTSTTTTATGTGTTGLKDSNNSSRSKKRRPSSSSGSYGSISEMTTNLLLSDQYLSEILSEKVSTQRDRRRGRVGVWRPHLESISESPMDALL